jgi:phage gpG-like protein
MQRCSSSAARHSSFHIYGNIPARPFMPIATDGSMMQQAETEIVQIMQDYLDDIISG